MLIEESVWIGEKLESILDEKPFPILNVGSSTKQYRTVDQPHVFNNVFSLIETEKGNVLHLDMKADEGVDLVGDLYNEEFIESLKSYKFKCILCNNILMYLDEELRIKLAAILFRILEDGGYLIVSNSKIYPSAPDPVESYYRAGFQKMYDDLFTDFTLLEGRDIETNDSLLKIFKRNPKYFGVYFVKLFLPFYKSHDWLFNVKYVSKLNKKFTTASLFLKKGTRA